MVLAQIYTLGNTMQHETMTQELQAALQTAGVATVGDLANFKAALLNELSQMLDDSREDCSMGEKTNERPSSEFTDDMRLAMKRDLALAFWTNVKRQRLKQHQVAQLVGMSRQKVSELMRQNVVGFSERKILECLAGIGCDVKITVIPGNGTIQVEAE